MAEVERALPQPEIAGVIFRHLHGAEDYPRLAAVHDGCREADQIDPLSVLETIPTPEEIAADLAPTASFDPARDALVVEAHDGAVIGYSQVVWWRERDGPRLYLVLGYLLPAWRGRGIGSAMLAWAEGRARGLAAADTRGGPAMYGANASSTERDTTQLLRDNGYREAFSLLEMELPADAAVVPTPLPAGIELRPATPAHYRAIWDSIQEAYAESPQNIVADEERYQAWLRAPDFDPSLWQIAWAGEEVAGQVLPEIARGRGEIAEVSVRKPYRGTGLARALLMRGLLALRARGATPIRLFCRADNRFGAPTLYRGAGFRDLKSFVRYRKPLA